MALVAIICILMNIVIIIGVLFILLWAIGDHLLKLLTGGYGLSDVLSEVLNNGKQGSN